MRDEIKDAAFVLSLATAVLFGKAAEVTTAILRRPLSTAFDLACIAINAGFKAVEIAETIAYNK